MPRARVWLPAIVVALSLLGRSAGAADFQEKRVVLVPFGGWTYYDRELRDVSKPVVVKSSPYLGGRLGVRLIAPLWLDLAGGHSRSEVLGRVATWTHVSANLLLVSSQPLVIAPFVSLGLGGSKLVPRWSADARDLTFEAAAGLNVKLTRAIGLRFEARNVLLVPRQDYAKSHIDDVVTGAGLVFAFGGTSRDSDHDGVPDRVDKCPDTPAGWRVDAYGCPIDSDGDGVFDGLDQCVDTPRGATVDSRGCPTDTDGDGVWDGLDRCDHTPKGCTVDGHGCPADADSDGVCDGVDQCPDTPRSCKVGANGCSLDSDGDGVCDGIDSCPDTPPGIEVDSNGCPPGEGRRLESELLETGRLPHQIIDFAPGTAVVPPDSHQALDAIGEVLSRWPRLEIEIGGHSGPRGRGADALALAGRRADAVRAYLLQRFPRLSAERIHSKAYAESRSRAAAARAAERTGDLRIDFKVLNPEVLRTTGR